MVGATRDPDRLSKGVVRLARWHALVLLPPLLASAIMLLRSGALWTARGVTRSGAPGLSYATGLILTSVICTALYLLAPALPISGGGPAMRAPTEGEQGCAVVLVRGFAAVTLWVVTYLMMRRI